MSADPVLPDDVAKEPHRSFTVRVPLSLYLKMSSLAVLENLHLNKKVNQLLRLGMGEHIQLDEVLMRLIKTNMSKDEPTNG